MSLEIYRIDYWFYKIKSFSLTTFTSVVLIAGSLYTFIDEIEAKITMAWSVKHVFDSKLTYYASGTRQGKHSKRSTPEIAITPHNSSSQWKWFDSRYNIQLKHGFVYHFYFGLILLAISLSLSHSFAIVLLLLLML